MRSQPRGKKETKRVKETRKRDQREEESKTSGRSLKKGEPNL